MKLLYIFIFLFSSLYCFAQTAPKQKAQNYYFYKKDGHTEVSTMDSADVIQVISEPDSGSTLYGVQEFYKNKSLRFSGQSLEVHPVKLQGQSISYYANGRKKLIATYNYGLPEGETYQYYPNGNQYIIINYFRRDSVGTDKKKRSIADSAYKFAYDSTGKAILENGNGHFVRYSNDFNSVVEEGGVKNGKRDSEWSGFDAEYKMKFTENYQAGKLINGNATDSAGVKYAYTLRKKPAEFPNGINGLGRHLGMNIRYPAWSREHNSQGSAIYQFTVSADGKLYNFKLIHSVDAEINMEALRVLKLMPNWIPGEYYGKKASTVYTIPISFTLQGQ